MMSPGRAQPKQLDIQAYMTPQGHYDSKRHKADQAIMERSKYHGMDPMAAIDAQQRDVASEQAVEGLLTDYPHLSKAQAQQLVASYQKAGGSKKAMRHGTPEHKISEKVGRYYKRPGPATDQWTPSPRLARTDTAPLSDAHYSVGLALQGRPRPSDPGDRIRDLMPGKLEPFIIQQMGPGQSKYVPNPEWGKQHGMIWDGERWVTDDPRKSSAHDLDMQMKQLQMDQLRQQIALDQQLAEEELRQKRGSTGIAGGLRDWLNKRLGGG